MEEVEAEYQIARAEYFNVMRKFRRGEATEEEVNEIRKKKDDLIKEKKKIRALEYYHNVIRPDKETYENMREKNRLFYHIQKNPNGEKRKPGRRRIIKYDENGVLIQNKE
jgi:hypothetical protein